MKSLWLPEFEAFIRFHDFAGGGDPPIVFLHGLGSAASVDFPAITRRPEFARFRCILPDFLGFGFSDRPAVFSYSLEAHAECIWKILQSLGIHRINLFGHSMGGTVAIAFAAAHPETVLHLILAEANLDPGVGGGSKIIAAQPEGEYVRSGHGVFVEGVRRDARGSPGMAAYLGALQLADPLAMHRSAVELVRGMVPSQREIFQGMKIPRAYMIGENSLPDPDVERLSAAGIRVPIIPKAGHAMMHDNLEAFAAALVESISMEC